VEALVTWSGYSQLAAVIREREWYELEKGTGETYPGGACKIAKSLLSKSVFESLDSWSTGLSRRVCRSLVFSRASKAGESPVEGNVAG
jgi:hypothetical protein